MTVVPLPVPPSGAVPPQNADAEDYILGATMISEKAIVAVSDILDAADFYRESNGMIYRAALGLWAAGEPVDAVTLSAELTRRGEIERVGGRVRLHELSYIVPASANVGHYAEIVRDMAMLRGLIRAGGEIAQLGWDRGMSEPDELIARAEGLVEELRRRQHHERDEKMTLYGAAVHLDEKFRNPPDELHGIPGPWSFMPRMGPGRMYVLSGYAKDGKTAAGCQFFMAAVQAKLPSTYLTLEMSKEDLAERIASTLGLPAKAVQSGVMHDGGGGELLRDVLGKLAATEDHGMIWDAPGADIPTIRAHVKARQPALLVVDHLHEFHLRPEYERQDLENVVRGLHRIAREFNIVVLLLAQLSRSGDKKRPYPPPSMSALKGSGAIEQLAWAVWFVYRQRDEMNLPTDESLFICAANRSGVTGTRKMLFHPRTVHYSEVVSHV